MKSFDVFLSQVFLSLETFLQKATTLNIFETLIFNYKIKVTSVEECSPQFLAFVVDLCNELQLSLRDNVVVEIEKPVCADKQASSFCQLQPANPNFVEFVSPLTNDSVSVTMPELVSKEPWEPACQASTPDCVEISRPAVIEEEHQPASPQHKDIYTCHLCNRKYRTNGKLLKHICRSASMMEGPREDEESVDDPGLSSAAVDQSESQCGQEEELQLPVYVCAACFCSYSQPQLFQQHSHADSSQPVELITDLARLQNQRKFSCGVCGEVYRSLARISYHVARCCAGPYQCELCNHVAHSKQLLNKHKKKHHKDVESFFCPECGLGFKLRTSLQKHLVNRHESGTDSHPCDHPGCPRVFLKKVQLTNHKIQVHGLQRKFLCQVCGHKFMTQDSLSCHLECHSNKKRFQCLICGKLFSTKEKMTFHVRTHTGEKPFVCERASCRKSFVSKSKLSQHQQRHSGERRHRCGVCGKRYANKPDLRLHLRKVHPAEESSEMSKSEPEPRVEELFPSQLLVPATTQLYSQYYQESAPVHTVTVPQSVVITSYQTVIM